MFCTHWKSLKGMGGDMKSVARFIVNLCDIMNGYIGKTIQNCIVIVVTEFLTIAVFCTMMVTLS